MKNLQNPTFIVLGVLQVVGIILKLTNVIDWSWWLILLPLYVAAGIVAVILGIVFLVMRNYT